MDNAGVMPIIVAFGIGITFVVFSLIFANPPSAMVKDVNEINLTIGGMKSTYEQGEPIVLSVSAKGISDNACNIVTPSVLMRDSGGKTIYWPNPFGFSTAMDCNGSEPIDKIWNYGDDPKSEFIFDKPGPYTLVASLEDVTIEKKFVVTS